MAVPEVVTEAEWQAARDALLVKEKAHTRAGDAVAAERRRLPAVEFGAGEDYRFQGTEGEVGLADLFDGRSQLVVYSFMLGPGAENPCGGCSLYTDNLPELSHLRAGDVNFVLTSRAPLDEILAVRERMGWTVPWYSADEDFCRAVGALPTNRRGEEYDMFAYTVFLKDGDRILKTYATGHRGVEPISSVAAILDTVPYGRQETWEDSPEGWPQVPPYTQGDLHVNYSDEVRNAPGGVPAV